MILLVALLCTLAADTGRGTLAADSGRADTTAKGRGTATTKAPVDSAALVGRDSAQPGSGIPLTLHEAERRVAANSDTTPQRRKRVLAVECSGAYGTRVTWHRWFSYAIIPLFGAQYVLGERLMVDQRGASDRVKIGHRAVASVTAGLYTFNTVTGIWNLWEGRHDPSGRTRKWVHAALFAAADAGFVYGATLAHDAQLYGAEARDRHRNVELASMGLSIASWGLMLLWKD